jgi:DhnA family fructose-bisphosphate aldolase class Ia
MENKNFTQKQIANWRRIAMNVNSDVIKRDKLQQKINEMNEELKNLNEIIEMQEYPVKMATGGYTTSDIFVKNVVTTDKVDANGRAIKKTTYELKHPESILPPIEVVPEAELHTDMDNNDII